MTPEAVDTDHWSAKIVAEVNDMHVKLVKLSGEFVWHHHEHEDELFLVVRGRLRMQRRDGDREVGPASSSWCRAASSTARSPSPTRCTSSGSSPRPR